MGSVPKCEVTEHALMRLEEHSLTLVSNGLSPLALTEAIKRVCENPEDFDRSHGGKRYPCFSLILRALLSLLYLY